VETFYPKRIHPFRPKISVKLAKISGKKINVSTLKKNPDRCAAPLINAYCKDRQQADPIANPLKMHSIVSGKISIKLAKISGKKINVQYLKTEPRSLRGTAY
jgi:hypothetical protein